METKKKIILKHKKNLEAIKKHNENYFTKDKPTISDAEYDKLKIDALNFENNYPYLQKFESISNIIGAKPLKQFKKFKHLTPMLSLNNAFEISDMSDFLKKIKNFLNFKNEKLEFFCEPKIDGISATLIYENGILIRGLSRGDGKEGEDILENLKTIKELPKIIKAKNIPNILEIRCEIYIGKKIFQNYLANLPIQEMLREAP